MAPACLYLIESVCRDGGLPSGALLQPVLSEFHSKSVGIALVAEVDAGSLSDGTVVVRDNNASAAAFVYG
jgi:hypothetical protein